MVRSKLIKIQVIFFFLLTLTFIQIFYIYPARAQASYIFESWFGWILFLAVGIGLIILSFIFAMNVRLSKILFRLGAISLVIGLVVAETGYAFPLLAKEVDISYEKCKTIEWGNLPYAAACIVTGYVPTSLSETNMEFVLINFWLTMLVILSILIYIFYDLTNSSGIIGIESAKRVISFGFGFLAFRGFLASQIVNFLTYGLFGVALIVINFIILGGLFAYANRFFSKYELIEKAVERRGAMKRAGAVLKEFLINVKNAPDPLEYFINNAMPQKTLFDMLGIVDEYNELVSYATNKQNKEFLQLLENILKKLK
jgi:hypothetical protein